jgi:valyl-tRNA synthetase
MPVASGRSSPYDPKAVERRLYERWERNGYFHEEPDPARPPFIICMPPPNVTGRAHLGHGSTYTPMDALVRYHRMLGDSSDWLPGTDHAAIATEARIVQELKSQGSTRDALGRERFVERAWEWSRTYGGEINEAFRALGFGPDWQRLRFTMDEGLSKAVRRVFVKLYEDGLIYRGKRLVNWDPVAKTTISDAEVEHDERDATLWYVKYPTVCPSTSLADARYAQDDNGGPSTELTLSAREARSRRAQDDKERAQDDTGIVIATTRPETMLGDVAIAVHPDDDRYKAWIGKTVLVPPLLSRAIPIIADTAVDPSFGTGAVKVTPAHDATDYEIGQRHGLAMPSIMDLDARIRGGTCDGDENDDVDVGPYAGLDRSDARARIVDDLRERGLLVKEEAYRHAIAVSERTGAVIEPLLLEQWFVKMSSLAARALQAYRDARVRFVPERYGRTYEQWLENIHDWNISRQVWWGHQLPVWYTPDGDVIVAESEERALVEARRQYQTSTLTRDADTLDTWFSSALWPFSILGWPDQTTELACWYPSQTLVTGGEIIFLWVARMVMLGLYVMDDVPFHDVFVTPLVFDAQGRKMSKSLGNAIDPMVLVEKYGADAFRVGVLRQLRLEAQEVRFQESRCEEARNFNNKIWNALRYVEQLPDPVSSALALPDPGLFTLADRWILTRLHDTVVDVTRSFDAYDFGNAVERVWHFVWYEFCDWYVEATKLDDARATRASVLAFVLNNAMRLLHPLAPFISEEVWLALPHDGDTIMTATWPDPLEIPVDREAAQRMEHVREVVSEIRNRRVELRVPAGARLAVELHSGLFDAAQGAAIAHFAGATVMDASLPEGMRFRAALDETQREDERRRLRKEQARLRAEVERGEKKLANVQFVSNAKPGVVEREREKLERYRSELAHVELTLSEDAP